jgi:hypothetical protein
MKTPRKTTSDLETQDGLRLSAPEHAVGVCGA